MNQPTIRDDIVAVITRVTELRVDQAYSLADEILADVTKTDRLVDQGKVYRVIETTLDDAADEHNGFTVYTLPEPEEIR